MKIAFVTDSTAGFTPEQIEQYGITVVPLSVIFGENVYREGVDITAEQFYPLLAASKQQPTTSQPPVGEFVAVFEKLLRDHDAVMCLLLSSKLSGTYHSAETAAKMVDETGSRIYVVDSLITSFGIAGPLMAGVELARRGGTPEDILALWEEEKAGQQGYIVVDTLEYLHRGGRIGGAAAVLGALLQIKPILMIQDGRIELYEKVRTHRKAMDKMISDFEAVASTGKRLELCVVHSARREDAEQLRDELVAKYPNVRGTISEFGPVVGTHTGPGALALLYYEPSPKNPLWL